MTVTCLLCKELLPDTQFHGFVAQHAGMPRQTAEHIESLEYQAAVQELVRHVQQKHPDYITVLSGTAHTYLFHLIAKLGMCSDARFDELREEARRLVYWTLVGKFAIEGEAETIKPASLIVP